MKKPFISLCLCGITLLLDQPAKATVILGEPAQFEPTVGQPLFPAGNLNIFKQFVIGFDVAESIGDTVEIDLLFATLEFGGTVDASFGASFGLEFGLCLGGNADFDMNFQPVLVLPDMYPSELPIPLTITEGLMPSSHFTTEFPPLGKMYADLIMHLEADLDVEACVFGCFDPLFFLDFPFTSCDLPALQPSDIKLFNESKRCDDALKAEKYCAIELASFNRNNQNKARMINVGADSLVEFFAEPYKEFSLGSSNEKTFTANPANNTVSVSGNNFPAGSPVRVSSTGTLPLGLKKTKIYYTRSGGGNISLANSPGGSAVSISSVGDGTHKMKAPDVDSDLDPLDGRYGSLSIAAPTINTSSVGGQFNTPDSLRSSGAEDVVGVGIDLAQMITDFLFPPIIPPLSDSGSLGPIGWEYTIASLEVGPAVQLQMDFEMDWDLVVTDITFSGPVRLFNAGDSPDFSLPANGVDVNASLIETGAPVGSYHLTNCGPHALPLIYMFTTVDGAGDPLPPASQQPVDVSIEYKLVPRLKTVVSLPFLGRVSYDVLAAGASIERVGELGFGPIIEGDHKFKFGEFEVYNGGASEIDPGTGQRGYVNFTMKSSGPPSFDWRPSQLGATSNRDWSQVSGGITNWRELISMGQNGYPGFGGGELSDAMIHNGAPGPFLTEPLQIETLSIAGGNTLAINEHTSPSQPMTVFTVGGLLENNGQITIDGDSTLKLADRESVICGTGNIHLTNGGTLRGSPVTNPAFCNYNTLTGAGYAFDQKFSRVDNVLSTAHNMGSVIALGDAGTSGSNQVILSLDPDPFFDDITWIIETADGDEVTSGAPASANPSTTPVNLADGDYNFIISDAFSDGENGSYSLSDTKGHLLASGENFPGDSATTSFFISGGSFLKTGAHDVINQGDYGARSGGKLVLDASQLDNRNDSLITAIGPGTESVIRAQSVNHGGNLIASDSGTVTIGPIRSRSSVDWFSGQSYRDDCGLFRANAGGLIHLQSTRVTGGCFIVDGTGTVTTNNSEFNGAVIEIGNLGNNSGTVDILGPNHNDNPWRADGHNILRRSCINNYGTLRVSGEAELIDPVLFANHGTVVIPTGGLLRVRQNMVDFPGASMQSQTQPGCANMTADSLVGGIWDIAGKLYIDGADFKVIGADCAPARLSSGSVNEFALPDGTRAASYDADSTEYISTAPENADPLDRPYNNTKILSEGRPAEVILRTFADFPALENLEENCGILRLVGGGDFRPTGEFCNKNQLFVGNPGNTASSVFEPGLDFVQHLPDAVTTIGDGGLLRSVNRSYKITGGTITSNHTQSIFNIVQGEVQQNVRLHIESPENETPASPQSRVVIDLQDQITAIEASAEVTIHGAAVDFPALTDHLRTIEGKFTISGGGAINAPDYSIAAGNSDTLTINGGTLEILGFTTKLKTRNLVQTGNSAVTRIGVGARLQTSTVDVNGGEFIFEVGSRPSQIPAGGFDVTSNIGVDFDGGLVIDFKDELAKSTASVDIGDTWNIIPGKWSAAITGIDTFEARLEGQPLPADWLPAGSHLELIQYANSSGNPRGLGVRVTPDGGFYVYDEWATDNGLDPDRFPADPFHRRASEFYTNAKQFLFGIDGSNKRLAEQGQTLDLIDVVTTVNGAPQTNRHAQFQFTRPFGTDASYDVYFTRDLQVWTLAPMVLTQAAVTPIRGELETVTMKSIYPVEAERVFFRVEANLNPDNFGIGELPNKSFQWTGGMNNFQNSLPAGVEYVVEPGKILYLRVQAEDGGGSPLLWGGTAEGTNERNFIYRDRSRISQAVVHAGFYDENKYGIVKVTFLDPQPEYFPSTQNSGTNNQITSKAYSDADGPYSYMIELIEAE